MLAYDFPLSSALIVLAVFFLWVLWLFLLFRTLTDLFWSDDLSGAAKVAWMIFLILLPYLGVVGYVFARGDKIALHELARRQARDEAAARYGREGAGAAGGGVSDELGRLAELRDRGVLTEDEFAQQKAKLLA